LRASKPYGTNCMLRCMGDRRHSREGLYEST
jgi:hypothetical protein